VPKSIQDHEQDVHEAFERALSLACVEGPQPFTTFERGLWSALLGLGRALVGLFLARQAARLRPTAYELGRVSYVLDVDKPRTTELGTRFGKVAFTRPVGRRTGWRSRCAVDLPVDRELGLVGGFSLETVTSMVFLCTLLSFETARRTFSAFCEWCPSPRAVLRMVDAVGEEARGFVEALPAPDDDGEILVIQVDGRGAPMIGKVEHQRRTRKRGTKKRRRSARTNRRHARRARRREHPKKRRTSGQKSKNAKVAVLAVIYTLRKTPEGLEGPLNKRIIGTFRGHDELFRWLVPEAKKRGYGTKRTLFAADGCNHIWRCQEKYLPDVDVCIDWYHVVEKLWEAGEALHGNSADPGARAAWVERQKRRLRLGRADLIIAELEAELETIPKSGPGNRGKRKRIADIATYLTNNIDRMHYDVLRSDDLDIGTGAAEGAVRNIVGMRLDGPGMRWGRERSELILQLRCIYASNLWPQFREYLDSRPLRLRPKPIPTRPHDAKRREPSAQPEPESESLAA
jgi:hypothetical protein